MHTATKREALARVSEINPLPLAIATKLQALAKCYPKTGIIFKKIIKGIYRFNKRYIFSKKPS